MAQYKETLRRIMDGDYDDATPEVRAEAVREVITVCSVAAGAVSIQPFPFLDIALVSPIQIGMVQAIGRIHGHRLDQKSVMEILSTFGASLVAQNVIVAAAKFVPFYGMFVGMAMAYALTWAIGDVSEHYFVNGRGVPPEELRSMFKKTFEEKKREKTAKVKEAGSSLKEKLQQLNEAREAGLLNEEEYEAKKAQVLADF